MGRRGPLPKAPELRQRTNARLPGRRLPTEAQAAAQDVPELPARSDGGWHPNVVEWWESIWRSPMASEWLRADVHGGLYLLAELYQARWMATTTAQLLAVAGEIRLQEVRFGLTPMDRKRLEWEVEKPESAAPVPEEQRRAVAEPRSDPRGVLKLG